MANWFGISALKDNDLSIGSVLRTDLEAVALELEELYYRTHAGLIDAQADALYDAFNFSTLQAAPSTGTITFRVADIDQNIIIPSGILVSTDPVGNYPSVTYQTTLSAEINPKTYRTVSIEYVSGILEYPIAKSEGFSLVSSIVSVKKGITTYIQNTDYILDTEDYASASILRWLTPGVLTTGDILTVTYTAIGVDVPVVCLTSGIIGRVSSNTIKNIDSQIINVESVTNLVSFVDGRETETNEERKLRFSRFMAGQARGTLESIRYALFNEVEDYTINTVHILENSPSPGFLKIYIADNTGTASQDMIGAALDVVEEYKGACIIATIGTPTIIPVNVDIRLRLNDRFKSSEEGIRLSINKIVVDHLNSYTFPNDSNNSELNLSTLDYVIRNADTAAILDSDVVFKTGTEYDYSENNFNNITPSDIVPVIDDTRAEIIKAGNVLVRIFFVDNGLPLSSLGKTGDFYKDKNSAKVYKKVDSSTWSEV
jgi:hypothetical protein